MTVAQYDPGLVSVAVRHKSQVVLVLPITTDENGQAADNTTTAATGYVKDYPSDVVLLSPTACTWNATYHGWQLTIPGAVGGVSVINRGVMARAVLDVTALGGSPQLAERVIQLAPATLGELGPGYPVVPRPRNSVAHAYLSGWTTADGTPRTPANAQALVWLSDNSLGLPNTTAAIVGGLNSVLMFQDGAGGWFYDLPASLFTAGFDYTLTIQGQDLAGNPLDTWYFRLVEQAS